MPIFQYWDGNISHSFKDGDELTPEQANAVGLRAMALQMETLNSTLKGLLHHFENNETTVCLNQ